MFGRLNNFSISEMCVIVVLLMKHYIRQLSGSSTSLIYDRYLTESLISEEMYVQCVNDDTL